MPKKFTMVQKRKWLERYENGETEKSVARAFHCDVRTVKKGMDEARRQRDATSARQELVKDALRHHQGNLLTTLEGMLSALTVPPVDLVPLPWYGKDSIFSAVGSAEGLIKEFTAGPPDDINRLQEELLREHLKGDRLWKLLNERRKALEAHWTARIKLQEKTVALLEAKTGYQMHREGVHTSPPFIFAETTGDLFLKTALRRAFGTDAVTDFEASIVADTAASEVKYLRAFILARAPGNEEECRRGLLDALQELQASPEIGQVVGTHKPVEDFTREARRVAQELLLVNLVPGRCRVCQRLGM